MRPRRTLFAVLLGALLCGAVFAQFEDPFQEGKRLFEEKKFAEALERFKQALEYLPDDQSILSWIGACHMSLAQYPEAEVALGKAIDAGGRDYRFFELLAASQVQQRKWDAAIATVKKYRDLTPDAEEAEHDQTLRTLESALRLEKRADCAAAEPPDRACTDAEAEAAWALKPLDPTQYDRFMQIWIGKAVIEQDPAKREEYLSRTEIAAKTWIPSATGADAIRAKAILGNVFLRQKRYDEAQATLEEVKKADPTFCAVMFDLARVQLGKGDFNAAKGMATEGIACAPDDPQGYLLRATAEYGLDDCPAVVKDGAEFAKRAAGKASPMFMNWLRMSPANSPLKPSSVKILPANRPNLVLRNCMNVAFRSAELGWSGLGNSRKVFTAAMAPVFPWTLSPKLLSP